MGVAMEQLVVILLAASVAAQDYGPVNLDSVDALTLNWNQIQWLVKDQIKEVEELREEHNELYNEITRCFGNEKCLAEFELLDMSPGSKLHGLGLRALDLSGSAMSRMREEVLQTKSRPDLLLKKRHWQLQRPRESHRPRPPPPPHLCLPHQEVHLRHSQEGSPHPRHPGQPPPPHTLVVPEVDKPRVKCSLVGTLQ